MPSSETPKPGRYAPPEKPWKPTGGMVPPEYEVGELSVPTSEPTPEWWRDTRPETVTASAGALLAAITKWVGLTPDEIPMLQHVHQLVAASAELRASLTAAEHEKKLLSGWLTESRTALSAATAENERLTKTLDLLNAQILDDRAERERDILARGG